jgi:hypothetical protein
MSIRQDGWDSLYPIHTTDPDGSVHQMTPREAKLEHMLKSHDPGWRAAWLKHIGASTSSGRAPRGGQR